MNFDMAFVIGVVAVSVALPFIVSQLRKKYGITKADYKMASDILNISIMIVEEMEFKKDDDIVKYATIVRDSIDFASNMDKDMKREQIKMEAYEYSLKQLKILNVEVNKRRKDIIMSLINSSMTFYNEKKRLN